MNNRRYHVIVGSKSYFYKKVSNYYGDSVIPTFLDLVKEADECKQRGISFDNHADNLIIPNDNYHGITAVSYTHLDVYKRQLQNLTTVIQSLLRLMVSTLIKAAKNSLPHLRQITVAALKLWN